MAGKHNKGERGTCARTLSKTPRQGSVIRSLNLYIKPVLFVLRRPTSRREPRHNIIGLQF